MLRGLFVITILALWTLRLQLPVTLGTAVTLQVVPLLGWYLWAGGHVLIDRRRRDRAMRSLARAGQKIAKLMRLVDDRMNDAHLGIGGSGGDRTQVVVGGGKRSAA